jgi:hypothetical protein
MKVILVVWLMIAHYTSLSQANVVDVGKQDVAVSTNMFYMVGGNPISTTKYIKVVDGTPYFNAGWMKGEILLPDGRVYDSLRLRLDLAADEVQYISPNGSELIVSTPVKAITFIDSISGDLFHFIHSEFMQVNPIPAKGWYQCLIEGKAFLYKKISKLVSENRPYGSATFEQSIESTDQYYIYVDRVFSRVKKISELPTLLRDKSGEIRNFISGKRLNGKKEMDYTQVVSYYHSLLKN